MPGDFGVNSWKLIFFSGFCAAMYRDGSMIGILINLIFRKGSLSKAGAIIVKERGQLVFCGLNSVPVCLYSDRVTERSCLCLDPSRSQSGYL